MLEGVRVVEVSMLAPSALGMHLADLGADVIKVEDPALGDYVRIVKNVNGENTSPLHRHWNRGKRSIALDLRTPEGVAVFEELVARSDVVVEGLRPGALERRGVGYARLRDVNPRIVFVSISGFGQSGPYRDVASHGPAFEAYAGLAPPARGQDGLPRVPSGRGPAPGIQATPMLGALGALAGVIRARETGVGCAIDVAESDGAVYWNAAVVDEAAEERRRREHGLPPLPPPFGLPERGADIFEHGTRCQYYETSDGRYVLFMALERKFLENFALAVDRPDLLSTSKATREFDHEYGNVELRRALTGIFRNRTQTEWLELFVRANVPAIPVNVGDEILDDPHFAARMRWLDADAHGAPMMALPINADPPLPLPHAAPGLGDHTDEVLREVLAYGTERIDKLRASGALGERRS